MNTSKIQISSAQAMTEWIEFYNNRRIRTKLKGKSPVQYRELANQVSSLI
ncbi:IS3 family transposase [Limosilactobacillus fermentum]